MAKVDLWNLKAWNQRFLLYSKSLQRSFKPWNSSLFLLPRLCRHGHDKPQRNLERRWRNQNSGLFDWASLWSEQWITRWILPERKTLINLCGCSMKISLNIWFDVKLFIASKFFVKLNQSIGIYDNCLRIIIKL